MDFAAEIQIKCHKVFQSLPCEETRKTRLILCRRGENKNLRFHIQIYSKDIHKFSCVKKTYKPEMIQSVLNQ